MFNQSIVVMRQPQLLGGRPKQMKSRDTEPFFPSKTIYKGSEDADTHLSADPTSHDAAFSMIDGMMQHAIQDATQSCDLALRWEALAWLWVCCPDIADQLLLSWSEAMPEITDVQQKAAAYMERYPA